MNIITEYLVVFAIIYVINHFFNIRNKTTYNKKALPTELLYLRKMYDIKITKDNYKKLVYTYTLTNNFIITTIYIILMYLVKGLVLRIIIGIVLLILMIIICYGLLGRYYQRKDR